MRLYGSTISRSFVLLLLGAMLLSGCSGKDNGKGVSQEEADGLTLVGRDAISVRWSPDGSKLAVVTTAGYLAIYEAKDDTYLFARYADRRTGFIGSRSLAWGADGNTVYYYDRPIDGKTNEPAPLEYGSLLMSANSNTASVTNVHPQFIESVGSVDATPDGKLLYINMYERKKYSLVTFQLQEGLHRDLTKELGVDPAGDSRLSRDGKLLFVNNRLSQDDRCEGVIIELSSGRKRIVSDRYLGGVSFSPDGRWLAYVGTDHTVFVISTDKQAEAVAIAQPELGVAALDWSPQGDRLALTTQAAAGGHPARLLLMEVPPQYRPAEAAQ